MLREKNESAQQLLENTSKELNRVAAQINSVSEKLKIYHNLQIYQLLTQMNELQKQYESNSALLQEYSSKKTEMEKAIKTLEQKRDSAQLRITILKNNKQYRETKALLESSEVTDLKCPEL